MLHVFLKCITFVKIITMKHIYKKEKIDTSKYVNIETGESLESEIPNITSVNKINTDMVIISSDEYIIIDSKALKYIRENFSNVEAARILDMSNMVKGCYNVLYKDKQTAHTKESLMETFEYNRNIFAKFLKKLYNKSIIYYIKGYKDNKEITHIMLNPHLARKSKTFSIDCINSFENISKL